MDRTSEFEALLNTCKNAVERFVYYKMTNKSDGDDVLQEIYITAFQKLDTLADKEKFKPWLISIARNKVNDFYRKKAKLLELPLDEKLSNTPSYSRIGITIGEIVEETLLQLNDLNKQILHLYYFKQKSQADIAKILSLPLGTVKSRLHNAKKSFKEKYPYPPSHNVDMKGVLVVKKLPEIMPEYIIRKSDKLPFEVKWEEIMGWFIVPRLGEKISWAMYDFPAKSKTEYFEIEVIGKAMVHSIEGVEIISKEINTTSVEHKNTDTARTFVAQLTDTHCRILLESHYKNDVKYTYTFFDEKFLQNWGFGENNCGNETDIKPTGNITKNLTNYTAKASGVLDIVGRYNVTINSKIFDTILVVDYENYNGGVFSEQYIDQNGKTVLWRRYNKDDWNFKHYKQLWSKKLPQNEKITVNGETYVHWYDCITDYVI